MKQLISTRVISLDNNQELHHTYKIVPSTDESSLETTHRRVTFNRNVKGSCVASQRDKTERTITEAKASFNVLDYEQWSCEVKDIQEDGLRVYAVDSRHIKNSRSFTMKRTYFESLCKEPFDTISEGLMFDWTFKRIKRDNGVIVKKEEISVYKRLNIPEWQLKQQVEEEMRELSFLFPNL